jgi:hypothetical protein
MVVPALVGLSVVSVVRRARALEEAWRGQVTFSTSSFSGMVVGVESVKAYR